MRLLVVGAGGHAKVVLDAALLAGFEIAGVVGLAGGASALLGIAVTHDIDATEADGFIIGIGDNAARGAEFARLRDLGMTPVSVVHPSAVIAPSATIGAGTFVAAGAIVNPEAVIGDDAIINTGCTIDHDCVVGDHALVGPTASLCGGAHVGAGTLVGAGTSIVPGVSVGEWSVIGAGSAVISDLPAHSICVGVPATAIKRIGA